MTIMAEMGRTSEGRARRFTMEWLPGGLLVALIGGVLCWLWGAPLHLGRHDPDHYYHLALARMMAQDGLVLASLPQADDLMLARIFSDPHFLFHVLASLAYRLGGDRAVEWLVPGFFVAIGLSLWAILRDRIGTWGAFTVSALTLLLNQDFFNRLFFLRPHLLGVLLFIWLVDGVLRARPIRVALICATYMLAYHAFYVPLAVLVASLATLRPLGKLELKVAGAGLAGCVVGILVHPYFPLNLEAGLMNLKLLNGSYPRELLEQVGDELRITSSPEFIWGSLAAIGLLAMGAFRLARAEGASRERFDLLWRSWVVTGLMLVVSGLNPRGREYLVPATAIFSGALLAGFAARARAIGTWALALMLIGAWPAFSNLRWVSQNRFPGWGPAVFEALGRIPASDAGKKIYNCDWGLGPFILYRRPDLKFVDLLDPHMLYDASSAKSELNYAIRAGRVADLRGAIGTVFKADYVLCNDRRVNQALAQQGGFRPIVALETPTGHQIALFSVERTAGPAGSSGR